MRYLFLVAVALGLSACQPPQNHYTSDGVTCTPSGYWFAPVYTDPRTRNTIVC
jgi:hypothetical protein